MNTVVLKAADPIAQNRQQSGQELLADLNSILPREQTDITVTQGNQGWGRYVYALLALLLVLSVMIYIRMIDQALAETTDAPTSQPIKAVEID